MVGVLRTACPTSITRGARRAVRPPRSPPPVAGDGCSRPDPQLRNRRAHAPPRRRPNSSDNAMSSSARPRRTGSRAWTTSRSARRRKDRLARAPALDPPKCCLSVQGRRCQAAFRLLVSGPGRGPECDCRGSAGGGALSPAGRPGGPSAERLTGVVLALLAEVCARARMLISVHDRAVWPAGDMMVMGCESRWGRGRAGAAARSLEAVHARTWRRRHVGSRQRCIA
jgi:hypothetical protein